jgi:hypothetical protein
MLQNFAVRTLLLLDFVLMTLYIQGHEYKVPVQDVVAVYKQTYFISLL